MANPEKNLIADAIDRMAASTERNNERIASLTSGEKYMTKSIDTLAKTMTENHSKLTEGIAKMVETIGNLSMSGKRLEEHTYDEIERLRNKNNTMESYHKAAIANVSDELKSIRSDHKDEIKSLTNEFNNKYTDLQSKAEKTMDQWRESFKKLNGEVVKIKELRAEEKGVKNTRDGFKSFFASNYMNLLKIAGALVAFGVLYQKMPH